MGVTSELATSLAPAPAPARPSPPRPPLRGRAIDVLMVAAVFVAVLALRAGDVVADRPWWVYALAIAFAYAVGVLSFRGAATARSESTRGWWLLVPIAATGAVTYLSGLGPLVSTGYLGVMADAVRRFGSRVARPVLAWSVITLGVGEIAVAAGLESVVRVPVSHGVALLAAILFVPAAVWLEVATSERERSQETSVRLLDLAHVLAEPGTRAEMAQRIAETVPRVVGLQRALVLLRDETGEAVIPTGLHGYDPALTDPLRAFVVRTSDTPLLAELLQEPRLVVLTPSSVVDDPFIQAGFATFGSVETYAQPIVVRGIVVGFLLAERVSGTPQGIDDALRARFGGLADQAAIALENGRLLEQEREALVRLQETDRMKSEFLAVVSHELRTPISVMLGAARTLQWRGDDIPADLRGELVESVVRRGEQLDRLVQDLLEASGEVTLELAPVDLASLARIAVADAVSIHPDARIAAGVPDTDVVVRADAFRIRQVVDNLVTNAVKYAPDGEIRVSVGWDGEDAFLAVGDNGPGMRPEQAERAFDAFYQVDSSAVRRTGGLGLGLHITRRIVEAHGGRIAIDTAPGAGMTVTVTLPVTGPGV